MSENSESDNESVNWSIIFDLIVWLALGSVVFITGIGIGYDTGRKSALSDMGIVEITTKVLIQQK